MTDPQFVLPLMPPAVTAIGASGAPEQVQATYGVRGDTCDWCKRTYPSGATVRDSETGKTSSPCSRSRRRCTATT